MAISRGLCRRDGFDRVPAIRVRIESEPSRPTVVLNPAICLV